MDKTLIDGRYRIGEAISNNIIEVTYYAALDTQTQQPVTLRVIDTAQHGTVGRGIEHLAEDKLSRKMETELRVIEKLNQKGMLTLLGHGFDDPFYYHVYPPFVFQNLQMLIDQHGKLPFKTGMDYFRQLVDVVMGLHQAGIIHCDISANTLLVLDGEVKLIEFTTANLIQIEGAAPGEPSYMSPEAIMGLNPAPPRDVWAIGVTIAYALHGKLPFGHSGVNRVDSVPRLFQKILTESPTLPSDIPDTLAEVFRRMMDKNPDNRITLDEVKTFLALSSF